MSATKEGPKVLEEEAIEITVATTGRFRRRAVRQERKKSFFYHLLRRKKKRSKRKNLKK